MAPPPFNPLNCGSSAMVKRPQTAWQQNSIQLTTKQDAERPPLMRGQRCGGKYVSTVAMSQKSIAPPGGWLPCSELSGVYATCSSHPLDALHSTDNKTDQQLLYNTEGCGLWEFSEV